MPIVSSEIREDAPQIDGRRYIREVHTDDGGHEHVFVWLAEPDQDVAAVMAARAVELSTVTLEQARQAKLAVLDSWYASVADAGVTVGQITIPAHVEDQTRYTSLVTMEHLALALGQRQLTDTSGLADVAGEWHAMPLAELFGLLLQYGAVCGAWSAHYADVLGQIHAADTIEALDAAVI